MVTNAITSGNIKYFKIKYNIIKLHHKTTHVTNIIKKRKTKHIIKTKGN